MKKQSDSKINIGKVTGNIVISQNQKSGITTQKSSQILEKPKKPFFNNKYVLIIGFVAAILGIFGYFGLQPSVNHDEIIPNEIIQQKSQPILTTIDTISIGDVSGDVVISQNQTGGITAHSINVNEIQSPEWSMGESEKIGENEWRTIFSARGKGNMAYYNWNVLFTLNTEVIKRVDIPEKISGGFWSPLSVQGGNLSKNHFFIGFAEFTPAQYFSIYLYSKEPIKVLSTEVLSDKPKNNAP